MKRTNLRSAKESNSIPMHVEEIAIGTINVHETTGEPIESQVVMSLKNFHILVDMIPKTSSRQALNDTIQDIKDKLTELTFLEVLSRQNIIDNLTYNIEKQTFLNDVEVINSEPRIVGKIDISNMV